MMFLGSEFEYNKPTKIHNKTDAWQDYPQKFGIPHHFLLGVQVTEGNITK